MDKPVFSANFKKDYIAYSAVLIFFLIISFEIFMAVFIPAHLSIEGIHAREVARQQMIGRFDGVRRRFLRFRSRNDYAQGEAKIIADSLTPVADYLRQYQYEINFKEIEEIDDTINGLHDICEHLDKQGAYSDNVDLKPEKFIEELKKEIVETD